MENPANHQMMLSSSSSSSSSSRDGFFSGHGFFNAIWTSSLRSDNRRRERNRIRSRYISIMLNRIEQRQQQEEDEDEDEDEDEESEGESEEAAKEEKSKQDVVKLLEEIKRAELVKYEALREHARAVDFEARVKQRELDLQVLYKDTSSLTPKQLVIHQRLFDEINERIGSEV